jgi:hypothetical protein
MSSQRRFAPIGVRFEPESVAGLAGIYSTDGRLETGSIWYADGDSTYALTETR